MVTKLGDKTSTWTALKAEQGSKEWENFGLASEWRFENGGRYSFSCSIGAEYKTKISEIKDRWKSTRLIMTIM